MNSVYGTDDLFENGWATADDANRPDQAFARPYPASSGYLTSLQLLLAHDSSSPVPTERPARIPDHYHAIFEKLRPHLASATELETYLFQPLIDSRLLNGHQASRIVDTLYDHNLLPATQEKSFFQVLGLLALELEVPGSGDYVTLQFRLNSGLPPLSPAAVDILLRDTPEEEPLDPLSAQLANTSITEESPAPEQDWGASDGLMADHSALLIDPDVTNPESIHVNDFPYLRKYVEDIRDQFKPLVGQNNAIKIREVPEKEGLLFKHINYAISHELNLGMNGPSGVKKVIRRYSDFVWLLEFLLKKYPFRVIPGLPPKKFSGM